MSGQVKARSSGSGSRLWGAMRRFSAFGRGGAGGGMQGTSEAGGPNALHLNVRIGVASGWLVYGNDLNNCAVKDRAKSEC